MSQKYDEYLEKHRQAVKKAYQWIAAYIPELTDVEATRNIEFHISIAADQEVFEELNERYKIMIS